MSLKKYNKILVIPDIHFPFADWAAIKKMHAFSKKWKPDLVVQLGDITDQKIWSRWPKDTDDFSPDHEFQLAYKDMVKFNKMFPKMHVILGNHDLRWAAKRLEAGLPRQLVREIGDVYNFPGWTWHDFKEGPLVFNTDKGKVAFIHGDEMAGHPIVKASKLGMHLAQGHTHQADLFYRVMFDKTVWGMNCGCLMDAKSKGARYAMRSPMGQFVGWTTIEKGVPQIWEA